MLKIIENTECKFNLKEVDEDGNSLGLVANEEGNGDLSFDTLAEAEAYVAEKEGGDSQPEADQNVVPSEPKIEETDPAATPNSSEAEKTEGSAESETNSTEEASA